MLPAPTRSAWSHLPGQRPRPQCGGHGPSGRWATWGGWVPEKALGAGNAFIRGRAGCRSAPFPLLGAVAPGLPPRSRGCPGARLSVSSGVRPHSEQLRGRRENFIQSQVFAWWPRSTCQAPSKAGFELCVVGHLGEGAGSRPPEQPCTLSRMEGEEEGGSPSLQSGPGWGTGRLWVPTLC